MGGSGEALPTTRKNLKQWLKWVSIVSQILIDKSLLGWKEYELE